MATSNDASVGADQRADGRRVIVVGVDGSGPSLDGLRWAAAQARLTGATVRAVYAWEFPSSLSVGAPYIPGSVDFEGDAARCLDEAVAEALGDDPPVAVRRSVVEGRAGAVLVAESTTADLLVVGAYGHGLVSGVLLGSVSEHCARHAACPLVIVRPTPRP